jgi:hypothetical protein
VYINNIYIYMYHQDPGAGALELFPATDEGTALFCTFF